MAGRTGPRLRQLAVQAVIFFQLGPNVRMAFQTLTGLLSFKRQMTKLALCLEIGMRAVTFQFNPRHTFRSHRPGVEDRTPTNPQGDPQN